MIVRETVICQIIAEIKLPNTQNMKQFIIHGKLTSFEPAIKTVDFIFH